MNPDRRTTLFVVIIFIVAITACGIFAYLGISFLSNQIDPAIIPTAAVVDEDELGVAITAVSADSPAALAGLRPGFIIIEANGVPIPDTTTLQNLVASLPTNSDVNLILLVDGERRQTTAVRGAEPPYLGIEIVNREDFAFDLLNTPTPEPETVDPSDPQLPSTLAIISEVVPESPAVSAGLQVGDVVTAVDGQAILTSAELVEKISTYAPGDIITLTFRRDADTLTRSVTLGQNPNDIERAFLGITLGENN